MENAREIYSLVVAILIIWSRAGFIHQQHKRHLQIICVSTKDALVHVSTEMQAPIVNVGPLEFRVKMLVYASSMQEILMYISLCNVSRFWIIYCQRTRFQLYSTKWVNLININEKAFDHHNSKLQHIHLYVRFTSFIISYYVEECKWLNF